MSIDIGSMREQYSNEELTANSLGHDPLVAFNNWFAQAVNANIREANAMTLATVDTHGQPDARIVLLKELAQEGFVFYSNYGSEKGQQLQHNNKVCLVFNWLELERQIRIKGTVTKYDEDKSTQYFQSRPRLSQIAAWSSPQSKKIESRSELEILVERFTATFEGDDAIPKPPLWGGYVVQAFEIEFWQGRRNRLHDRIKYYLTDQGWQISRLAP